MFQSIRIGFQIVAALTLAECCAGMLDHIRVEAYGEKMQLHTLATVLARDAQLLVASVYDPSVRACFE
jgi:ribosome recycling factor